MTYVVCMMLSMHHTDNFYDTFMVSFLSWILTAPVHIDRYYIVARILLVVAVVVFYLIN